MAAAARPGPADARVPCPLCGGLIHPIAGRCKHCKGDLRALRSTRPAAAATLPALNHGAAPAARPPVAAPALAINGHANGHAEAHHAPYPAGPAEAPRPPSLVQAVAAAAPIPLAFQGTTDAAVPILPPRPTGRFAAAAPRASWKSWPVIVIVLAVIAILVAVILMVFPPGGPKDAGTKASPPPAPDRMDTNPTPSTPRQPPSTSPDPWSRATPPPPPAAPTPPAAPSVVPDVDIDDPDLNDPTATRDPFSRRGFPARTQMLYSIIKHACARVAACGASTAQTKQLCDRFAAFPTVAAPSCAAATRCLRSIDEMSCDVSIDDPMKLLGLKDKFTDCTDALSC